MTDFRRYCLISPVRNEQRYAERTLASVTKQTILPALWVIVDDGSTDATPIILEEYAKKHPYIRIVKNADRGFRKVGGGVVDAFNKGYATIDPAMFDYICKLDMDLDLPSGYFEALMKRMEANPRIGTCSGKAYFPGSGNLKGQPDGELISERCGDETSLGMTKFYRTECFEEIGGFVSEVMWDGIDCHTCRMLGWIACSWDDPELRFIHLRPMGSSDRGVFVGRKRHGYGQYFIGTTIPYIFVSAIYRALQKPYLIGGLGILFGYFSSMFKGLERYQNAEFRRYLSRYQYLVLRMGKSAAIKQLNEEGEFFWKSRNSVTPNHTAATTEL